VSTKLDGIWLRRYLWCVGLFAVSLIALPLAALVTPGPLLPGRLRNAMFFWPQYLLLPNGFVPADGGPPQMFRSATLLAVPVWLAAIAVYAWLTRRRRLGIALLALLPLVALLLDVGLRAIDAFSGLRVMLDGP
jgi:hypothetical protein